MAKNENDDQFTKSTATLDAEARLAAEEGNETEDAPAARSFAVEGNDLSEYVGVSPEYQTYAEETHKPLAFEDVEGKLVERQKAALSTDVPEGVDNKRRVEKVEEVEVEPAARVEPKQATFNIPAVTNDGSVSGDTAVVKRETGDDKKAAVKAKE